MIRESILIVDDNADDIFITRKASTNSRPDSFIEHAANGCEALDFLRKGSVPAMIFLDYKMPGMSGIDVLQQIRKRGETRYIPVVMLTSSNFESDMKAAYDAGANSYLTNTFNLGIFMEEIKTVLNLLGIIPRSLLRLSYFSMHERIYL